MVITEKHRPHRRFTKDPVTTGASSSNGYGSEEDLLERGFRLAYFLLPNRSLAVEILENALNRLDLQRGREKRRRGWRKRSLKRKITRIVFDRPDALQWLIYFESTDHERQRERHGEQTTADMIVHYVKNLVQFTTGMSSFYVNIGIHRLLYDYSTSEAQGIYELSTQHYTSDAEYRRVKGVIMEAVQARFDGLLRVSVGDYRERKFEVLNGAAQEKWADWVNRCLTCFIPWSTRRVCLNMATPESECGVLPSLLSGEAQRKASHDVLEIQRCHMFISPSCHHELTQRVKMVSPRERLAVPRFLMNDEVSNGGSGSLGSSGPWGSRDDIPILTEEDRRGIRERLSQRGAERKQMSKQSLRILADGVECARLDVFGQDTDRECELREGVKLIEICAQVGGTPIPFAIHWIDYLAQEGVVPGTTVLDLENGRELLLQVSPIAEEEGMPRRISLRLRCRPVSCVAAWKESLGSYTLGLIPKAVLGGISLVVVGWILGGIRYSSELTRERAAVAQAEADRSSLRQLLENTPRGDSRGGSQGETIATYRLHIGDAHRGFEQSVQEQVIHISPHAPMTIIELPVSSRNQPPYRVILKSFADNSEVLAVNKVTAKLAGNEQVLSFPLATSLVEDGEDYEIDVYSTAPGGTPDKIRTFIFSIAKEAS